MAKNICILGNLTTVNGTITGSSLEWNAAYAWLTSMSGNVSTDEVTVENGAKIITGDLDPSSVGVTAPLGSIYLNNVAGELYFKTSTAAATSWQRACTL